MLHVLPALLPRWRPHHRKALSGPCFEAEPHGFNPSSAYPLSLMQGPPVLYGSDQHCHRPLCAVLQGRSGSACDSHCYLLQEGPPDDVRGAHDHQAPVRGRCGPCCLRLSIPLSLPCAPLPLTPPFHAPQAAQGDQVLCMKCLRWQLRPGHGQRGAASKIGRPHKRCHLEFFWGLGGGALRAQRGVM